MQTKYKVLNPMTGEYTQFDDNESAMSFAKELAWEYYLIHTHSTPVSKVVITAEGHEVWGSD